MYGKLCCLLLVCALLLSSCARPSDKPAETTTASSGTSRATETTPATSAASQAAETSAASVPKTYTETREGIVLRVTVENSVCKPGELVRLKAEVSNTTDKDCPYWIGSYEEDYHLQIRVRIAKDKEVFSDVDIYRKGVSPLTRELMLSAGGSYEQPMRMLAATLGDSPDSDWETAEKTNLPPGEYEGTAVFHWGDQDFNNPKNTITVSFPIAVT